MKLTAWRAALRIARRDALRAKGRSALVLAMIALPVLGVAGADVVYRSAQLSPLQRANRLMGGADALISLSARGLTVLQAPVADDGTSVKGTMAGEQPTAVQRRSADTEPADLIRQLMPPGSTLLPLASGPGVVTSTRDGQLEVGTAEMDLSDPVWRGKINLVQGRVPSAPREIAATRAFLDKAALKVGDATTVRGLENAPFTVTAVVEYPGALDDTRLVARPGELIAPLQRGPGGGPDVDHTGSSGSWLLQLPAGDELNWAGVRELNSYGFTATSRSVMLAPPPRSDVPYYVEQDRFRSRANLDQTAVVVVSTAAGMELLEIVLLAGPAFAVGARRSRRQLGLLAAGGGDRSHIRAVVLGGGAVLGLAGAAVGLVLAIGSVAAARPWLENLTAARFGSLGVRPLDLLAIALLGLITGLLAAIVPALQAARQDVLAALTGRDSVRPASRRLALLGLLMVAGGAVLALLGAAAGLLRSTAVLGGSVVAELGMVALTPMLVGGLGRLGRWLPLSPRLALRDAVRHRGRTAPAVAAVMAAVAGAVAVGIYGAGVDAQNRQLYIARQPSGGVELSLGWGPANDEPAKLPQLRAEVERTVPALGARGDVYRTAYPNGCTGRSCGYVQAVIPPERRCPATDRIGPVQRFDQAEYERLMREDPRCAIGPAMTSGAFGMIPAGDATVLRNLLGVRDQAAVQALADGKVLVFDPRYVKDGKVILELTEPPDQNTRPDPAFPTTQAKSVTPAMPATHQITADAVVATAGVRAAVAFLTPQTAQRLGLASSQAGSVWLPDNPPGSTAEQKAIAAVGTLAPGAHLGVERGYQTKYDLVSVGLTGFAALVALGAAGIATGLAAADSQRDLATLAAVGAHGGIRRRLAGFQCGVIAAAGAVLGTVCGFVPAVALRKLQQLDVTPGMASHGVTQPLAIPWLNIGLMLIVLPTVAVLLAMLLTRSRIVLARRAA